MSDNPAQSPIPVTVIAQSIQDYVNLNPNNRTAFIVLLLLFNQL